jgi:predicted phage tail protein
MIRTIFLHGPLAKRFGAGPYRLHANNFRELLSGLSLLHPGFKRELLQHTDLCIMLADPETKKHTFLETHELGLSFSTWPELHLGVGTKGSAGGAEFVAAYFFEVGTAAYYAAYAVAYVAIVVAVSYAVSAIMMSMTDVPSTEDGSRKQDKSSLFNGPENRESQGGRVQLVFGKFLVGSYTISQSIEARRQAIGMVDTLSAATNTTVGMNIFANDVGLVSPYVTSYVIDGNTTTVTSNHVSGNLGGAVYSGAGYTIAITYYGDVSFTASTDITVNVSINCTSSFNTFTQALTCTATTPPDPYEYNGGGGGDGMSGGGDSSTGEGGGGGGGDAAGVGTGTA